MSTQYFFYHTIYQEDCGFKQGDDKPLTRINSKPKPKPWKRTKPTMKRRVVRWKTWAGKNRRRSFYENRLPEKDRMERYIVVQLTNYKDENQQSNFLLLTLVSTISAGIICQSKTCGWNHDRQQITDMLHSELSMG